MTAPDRPTEAPDAAGERIKRLPAEWAQGRPARRFRFMMEPMGRALVAEQERDEAEAEIARIDALTARCEQAERREAELRDALEDVRGRVHTQLHAGYVVGAVPADQCYRWICDVVNRALAAPGHADQEDSGDE